jgi:Tfp pilus assembly protein PilF
MTHRSTLVLLIAFLLTIACSQQSPPSDKMTSGPSEKMGGMTQGTNDPLGPPAGAPAAVAASITQGNDHYAQGHYDVAASHYEKALSADSTVAEAHFNLAVALDKLGHHEEAMVHFDEANTLGKSNPAITGSEILHKHIGG